MKLRYQIAGFILLLVTVPLIALAIALSYESECAPAPVLPDGATAMKAIVLLKPANAAFEEAAAIPIAAVTALEALRDHGRVQAGQKVLINGASGGVGTYAVQIAKSFGADVTGVCSARNVQWCGRSAQIATSCNRRAFWSRSEEAVPAAASGWVRCSAR